MTQLVRYENARVALAAVHSYDEVKDIMDQAERAELYARQANDNQLIQYATEIRVRAQRRAGEMLAKTPKSEGSKGIGKSAVEANDRTKPTLSDMGITKDQSANWQSLASMSDEHFETAIETAKETAGQVTNAFMQREAKKHKPVGKPKTGPKADSIRQELKAAKERGTSMLCSYARLLLDAIKASDSLTEQEHELLEEVTDAISKTH